MSSREIEITHGSGGKYQKQTAFTQLAEPLLGALIYAVTIFFYVGMLYFEAVLVGRAFSIILVAFGIGMLMRVEYHERKLSVGFSQCIPRRFKAVVTALLLSVLFIYLQWVLPWPWRFQINGGRLWITLPRRSFSVAAWLEALHWLTVGALPFALIPAGRELLARLRMDIFAPNLADNIRTTPGRLRDKRWVEYTDTENADEPQEYVPTPTWQ